MLFSLLAVGFASVDEKRPILQGEFIEKFCGNVLGMSPWRNGDTFLCCVSGYPNQKLFPDSFFSFIMSEKNTGYLP